MVAMAGRKALPFTAKLARWRPLVQAAFLLAWLDPFMLRLHTVCGPVFHCYSCPLATFACPIGVIAKFSALHVFPFIAVGTVLVAGALLGSFICGWICPFGFLQDMIGRIPTPKFRLPSWSRHVRLAVLLGLVLAVPFFFGEKHPLFICSVCPAGMLEGWVPFSAKLLSAGQPVVWPNVLKIAVTVLVLVAMFFTWRPWCRLFCPLGAIYGLMNRVSAVFLRFRPTQCTSCTLCHRRCRYGARPDERSDDPACIRCLECTQCEALDVGWVVRKAEEEAPEPASQS